MAKILLAEDDTAIREMVQRALVGDGHTVVAASDGAAALEAAGEGPYDVLVSDISMPEPDGVALAEQMLASQPGLRVILMSAIADELQRAQSLGGGVRVLSKPVSLEQIRKDVAALLAG